MDGDCHSFFLRRVRHMRRIWKKTTVLIGTACLLMTGQEGRAAPALTPAEAAAAIARGELVVAATVERPSLTDSGQAEREVPVEAALERALASSGQDLGITRLAAAGTSRALTVRDMALQALERNLAVWRSGIAQDIARQTLLQAEALFRPVLSLSFDNDYSHSKARALRDYKFKKALVPCEGIADMPAAYTGKWCQLFSEGPVLALVYANPREAGFYYSRIDANQVSTFDATSHTLTGQLIQRLPWGQEVTFTLRTRYKDSYYTVKTASALLTSDPYDRPWTMGIGVQTTLPLPFTRTFGVSYEPNLTRTIAEHALEAQGLGMKAVVNETLRQVESDYWALVNAVSQVEIADRMKKAATDLDTHTANLYERG